MRRLAVVLVAVFVLAPSAAAQPSAFAQESIDPDAVVMTAAVEEAGDADWTVAYRVRLDDDNATTAFESYRSDLRANRSAYVDRFAGRMGRTVGTAENATGREMAVKNVTVSTSVQSLPQEYGVVTYRFRWTNFAATDGDRLQIGDALAGLFLDAESSLRVRWPAGYGRTAVAPDPDASDNRSVTWRGPRDFGPDEPSVAVRAGAGADGPSLLPAAGALAVLLVGVVAVALARRTGLLGHGDDGHGDDGHGTTAGGANDSEGTDDADEARDGPPPELLSNEEQVLRLLGDNDGRMKQAAVADRLEWTAAKTSQVIGGLREDDDIETFRIGRENVVTLPDVGVAEDIGEDDGNGSDEDGDTNDDGQQADESGGGTDE